MATTTLTQTAVVQRLWHAVEVMRQVEEAKRRETGATALLNFLFGSALEGVSPDAPLRCSCHFSAAQESRPPTNHHYSTQQGATLREVLGTRLEVHPCPFSQRLGVPLKHNRFVVNITQKGISVCCSQPWLKALARGLVFSRRVVGTGPGVM